MEFNMAKEIESILRTLVSYHSISGTELEQGVEKYVHRYIGEIPYFKKKPNQFGNLEIPEDPFRRSVPYGVVIGKTRKTVILSGHLDVVETDVYGEAKDLAFSMTEELENKLSTMELSYSQRKDLESKEWFWGRGTADMKGGIAISMALLKKYAEMAERGELEGTYIFIGVADEECYSAGMRATIPLYRKLKEEFDLEYKLLIDPEPSDYENGNQVLSLGTVGKNLPVIMTQGKLSHVGKYFNGINALNMLNGIFNKTNGSLDFVDTYKGEANMPPAWQYMKDMKEFYDVSLPYRACGYISILSYTRTSEEILKKLKAIGEEVFKEEVEKLNNEYKEFKLLNKFAEDIEIEFEPHIYTVKELCEILKSKDEGRYNEFYNRVYEESLELIHNGKSYPEATIYFMNKLLDFTEIKTPIILIGMAPPYYPATHSDHIEGKEGYGSKIFNFANNISTEKYGQPLTCQHFFNGICDNSYTSLPNINFNEISGNYPLWGRGYILDLEGIRDLSVPAILYGPIGIEYHQWTERVNKKSLLEITPNVMNEIIHYAWKN